MSFKRGHQLATLVILLIVFGVFLFLGADIHLGITGFTFVEGNESTVSTVGVSSLSVLVNGSSLNTSVNYTGVLGVEFFDGSNILANVSFDFDANVLNLSNVTVEMAASAISVNGVVASKAVYLGKSNTNKVCVKDVDGASIASITSSCTGPFETLVTCDGTVQSGYVCSSFNSTTFEVSGLTSSAVASLELEITSVVLDTLGQGAWTTLNISGTGFESGANVTFADPDISVLNSSFISSTDLNATVYVALNTTEGDAELTVTNPDGNSTSYNITIVEGPLNMSSMSVYYSSNITGAPSFFNITLATSPGVVKSTLNFSNSSFIVQNATTVSGNISLPNATDPPEYFYFTGIGAMSLSGYWDMSEFYTTVTQSGPCVAGCEKEQEGYYYYPIYSGPPTCDISPDCVGGTFTVGDAFLETLFLVGGLCVPPVTLCSVIAGALPPGIGVAVSGPTTCDVSGVFTTPGLFSADVNALDSDLPPNEGITTCDFEVLAAPTGGGPPSGGGGTPVLKFKPDVFCVEKDGCMHCTDLVPGLVAKVGRDGLHGAVVTGQIEHADGVPERSETPFVMRVAGSRADSVATKSDKNGHIDTILILANKIEDADLNQDLPVSFLPIADYDEIVKRGTTYASTFIANPAMHFTSDNAGPVFTVNGLPVAGTTSGPDCPRPTPEIPSPTCPEPQCITENGEATFVAYVMSDSGSCDEVRVSEFDYQNGFAASMGGPSRPPEPKQYPSVFEPSGQIVQNSFSGVTGAAVSFQAPSALGPVMGAAGPAYATTTPGVYVYPQPPAIPPAGGAGAAPGGGMLGLQGPMQNCFDPEPEPDDCFWVCRLDCPPNVGMYGVTCILTPQPPCQGIYNMMFNCPGRGKKIGWPGFIPRSPGGYPMPAPGFPAGFDKEIEQCCLRKCPYEKKTMCVNGVLKSVEEVPPTTPSGGTMTPEAIAACGKKEEILGTCDECTEEMRKQPCSQLQVRAVLSSRDARIYEDCCTDIPKKCPKEGEKRSCVPEGAPRVTTKLSTFSDTIGTKKTVLSDAPSSITGGITGLQLGGIPGAAGTGYQIGSGYPTIFVYPGGVGQTMIFGQQPGRTVVAGKSPPPSYSIPSGQPVTPSNPGEVVDFVPEECLGEQQCINGEWTGCELPEGKSVLNCYPKPKCGDKNIDAGEQCDPPGSACLSSGSAGNCDSDCKCQPGPPPSPPPGVPPSVPPTQPVPPGVPPPGLVPTPPRISPPYTPLTPPGPNLPPSVPTPAVPPLSPVAPPPVGPTVTPTVSPPKSPTLDSPDIDRPLVPDEVPPEDTCTYSQDDIVLERIKEVPPGVLPQGTEFAFGLRTLNRGGGIYDITAAISEIYGDKDTHVLKCSKTNGEYSCVTLDGSIGRTASCGGLSYNKLLYEQMDTRDDMIDPSNMQSFTKASKTLTPVDMTIEQSGFRLDAQVPSAASFSIGPPGAPLQQPPNPYMAILNAMEVEVPTGELPIPATITIPLPKPLPSNIDKYTIRLYVWYINEWTYLESVPDLVANSISGQLSDLRPFAVDGKAYFAVIGATCHACVESKFDLVYDGGGEKAVVLVHGLTSSGIGTWAPLIKEIETAKLPVQVYTFSYPAWRSLDTIAMDLADAMETLSYKYKIFPVGHSIGGLVVEQALYMSHLERERDPTRYKYLEAVKHGAAIILGTPNKGSPVGDVWKNLFAYIAQARIPETAFNLNSPLLKIAVSGIDIPPVPYIRYFVIAGTKPLEFNLGFFTVTTEELVDFFSPNDGMIPVESAYTLATNEFNDPCNNYFEMYLSHIELNDHEIARRIIERIINQQFRDAVGAEEPWPGYSKYVNFKGEGWKEDDLFIIVSSALPDAQQAGVMPGCRCGNAVCGEDESIFTCPSDCFVREVGTFCVVAPFWLYALLCVVFLVFAVHAVKKRQKHGIHSLLFVMLAASLGIIALIYLICEKVQWWALLVAVLLAVLVFYEGRMRGFSPSLGKLPPPPPKPQKIAKKKGRHGHAAGDYDSILRESEDLLRKFK